jgi:predicted amidohydrolase
MTTPAALVTGAETRLDWLMTAIREFPAHYIRLEAIVVQRALHASRDVLQNDFEEGLELSVHGNEFDIVSATVLACLARLKEDPDDLKSYLEFSAIMQSLDSKMSQRRLRIIRVSEGVLLLGQRFWSLLGAAQALQTSQDYATAHELPTSPEAEALQGVSERLWPVGHIGTLSHMRWAALDDNEWVSLFGGNLDSLQGAAADGEIRIALATLSGKSRTHFRPTRELSRPPKSAYGFVASHVQSNGETDVPSPGYLDELKLVATWARSNAVHVLCLPELAVCTHGRDAIRSTLEEGPHHPALVVAGSFHEKGADADSPHRHFAPVWVSDSSSGRYKDIARYEKNSPFDDETSSYLAADSTVAPVVRTAVLAGSISIREDVHIPAPPRVLCVLTAIGVIGVAICRDLLHDEVKRRYKSIADHVIGISMNAKGKADFWSAAEDMALDGFCASFYVNAAQVLAADDSLVDVSLWRIPTAKVETAKGWRTGKGRARRVLPSSGAAKELLVAEGEVEATAFLDHQGVLFMTPDENGIVLLRLMIPEELGALLAI